VAKLSKAHIELLMLPQIKDIVQYWNVHGQIFEWQFDFACSGVMEDNTQIVFDIMQAHGADSFSDEENSKEDDSSPVYTTGVEIPNEGWRYTLFAWGKMDLDTAEANVKTYFVEI